MSKEQIDSILLVNSYLAKCTCEIGCNKKKELTRRYLSKKISRALEKKSKYSFFGALLLFFGNLFFFQF
jgi:hypothetical protein